MLTSLFHNTLSRLFGLLRHIYVQQLVAGNFAKNRENFTRELIIFEHYFSFFSLLPVVMLQKSILSIIDIASIFDWEWGPKPQITCNDIITNFESGIFCGGKDIVEWNIRSLGLVLARNLEIVQGKGLKPIVKSRKCLNWETCLSKEAYCNSSVSDTGVWGHRPTADGQFFVIFWKKKLF